MTCVLIDGELIARNHYPSAKNADCERLLDTCGNSLTSSNNRFLSIGVDGNVFGCVGTVAG